MNNLKIGFLTREYPPDTVWGGEAFTYRDLAVALAANGHEVHVVCQAIGPPKDYCEDGVHVHRVGHNSTSYSARARLDYGISAWFKMRELIRKRGVEIVDGPHEGTDTLLYSFLRRTPLVVQFHGSIRSLIQILQFARVPMLDLLRLKILLLLSDLTARRADMVVAIAPVAHEELVKVLRIRENKLRLIYQGKDLNRFQYTESNIRERLGIPTDSPLIMAVGRLEPRKGTRILCEAIPDVLKTFPDAHFVMVGKDSNLGPGGSSFKSFISKELEHHDALKNTLFIDYLSSRELAELYSASDLGVLASLNEVASAVLFETMAYGKPIVATPVGNVNEYELDGSNGLIVPANDSRALANGISRILSKLCSNDAERDSIALRNRSIVQRIHRLDRAAQDMAKMYSEVISINRNK